MKIEFGLEMMKLLDAFIREDVSRREKITKNLKKQHFYDKWRYVYLIRFLIKQFYYDFKYFKSQGLISVLINLGVKLLL